MTVSNSALNFGFAYEQAVRVAAGVRGAEETVAQQIRQENQFPVGSTVTARYRYKVAEDGSFVPLQSQITTEAAEDVPGALADGGGRRNRRALARGDDERTPSFRDFSPVRPSLSPADEASLFNSLARAALPGFAYVSYTPRVSVNTSVSYASAEALDGDGAPVEADIIIPNSAARTEGVSYSAGYQRAQFSVATLYARNAELANISGPATLLAA